MSDRERIIKVRVHFYDHDARKWKSFEYDVPCTECTPEEVAENLADILADEWRQAFERRTRVRLKKEVVDLYRDKMYDVLYPLIKIRRTRDVSRIVLRSEEPIAAKVERLVGRILLARRIAGEKWVIGINTSNHILLDFDGKTCDCLRQAVALGEGIRETYGGRYFIVETEKGLHLYTTARLTKRAFLRAYSAIYSEIERFPCLDEKHVKLTVQRGYVTLGVRRGFKPIAKHDGEHLLVKEPFFSECGKVLGVEVVEWRT